MKHKGCVSEVIDKNNKLPPILVSFEHGDLRTSEVSDLRCTVLQKKTGDPQRVVAVATSHLQYMNRVTSDPGLATVFLAVRNKKTNKVRLIETECFTLSPSIKKERTNFAGSDVTDVHNESAQDRTLSATTNVKDRSHQFSQLSKSFGSKMSKRKQEQIERTTIHVDNLEEQLANVTQKVEVTEEDLKYSSDGINSLKELLPPYNPDATSPSGVYELTNILSPEELKSLDFVCDEILADPDSYTRHSPTEMFTSCLQMVLVSKDRVRLKALLYADCLAKFLSLTVKNLARKDLLLCPYSVPISNNILNNFCTSTGNNRYLRTRSSTDRDKALCHIIILGLLACNFQLNLEPVVKSSSRIGLKKLQELRRIVGAVPLKNNPNTIVLSVPLLSMKDIGRNVKLARKKK